MDEAVSDKVNDEKGAHAVEAFLHLAQTLRKSDPEGLIEAYSQLLFTAASAATPNGLRRFMARMEKLAVAQPAWRQAIAKIAERNPHRIPDAKTRVAALKAQVDTALAGSDIAALVELKSALQLRTPLPYDKAPIEFSVSSEQELAQVQKFKRREVETQQWIEGFGKGDVFYDIGANIGLFTLLAACQPTELTVVAVEPTFASFHSLCQNLWLNQVSERVIPLQAGLSDRTAIERLQLRRLEPGTAKSVVGEAIDHRNMPFQPAAVFNVPVLRLDDAIAIYKLPVPNHIKVDVDGIEMKVLAGAEATLARPELRSIMVEAASADMEHELEQLMGRRGFELFRKADKKIGAIEEGHTRNNYFRRS